MSRPLIPGEAKDPAPRGAAGFTLLELIVVLGIFAVMAVMAYGGLSAVLNARASVERALARTAAMQKAYMRLRDDLQQLSDRPVRDEMGEPIASMLTGQDGSVEFTRAGWRNPLLHPRPTLERVTYRLDDKSRLIRSTWPMLDRAPDTQPGDVLILEGIDAIQWRFLDPQLQWQSQWPKTEAVTTAGRSDADTPPPRAVEVTLQTKDWGELRFLFATSSSGAQGGGTP